MTELEQAHKLIAELTEQREQLKGICYDRDIDLESYGYFDEDSEPDSDEDEE